MKSSFVKTIITMISIAIVVTVISLVFNLHLTVLAVILITCGVSLFIGMALFILSFRN